MSFTASEDGASSLANRVQILILLSWRAMRRAQSSCSHFVPGVPEGFLRSIAPRLVASG